MLVRIVDKRNNAAMHTMHALNAVVLCFYKVDGF